MQGDWWEKEEREEREEEERAKRGRARVSQFRGYKDRGRAQEGSRG
jgi:hypothetical protein